MGIGDEFSIDYANRRIYHSSGATVYTVNALYSWLMDTFDELDLPEASKVKICGPNWERLYRIPATKCTRMAT